MGMIRFFLNLMLNECKGFVMVRKSSDLNNFPGKKCFCNEIREGFSFLF